jgi:hypothetical protein
MSRKNLIIIPNNLPPDLQRTLLLIKNELDNLSAPVAQAPIEVAAAPATSTKITPLTFRNVRFVGGITGKVGKDDILSYTYPTISQAIASIGDNTITNQYVILVFPGTYLEDFTCKDYVHILGTGENVIIEAQTSGGIVGATSSITNVSFTQLSSISDATTASFGSSASCTHSLALADTNYHNTSAEYPGYLYLNGSSREALLSFSLPTGATVTAATINLYMTRKGSSSNFTLSFYGILRNYIDTQETYNSWTTGNPWTTAGAGSVGNDISATSKTYSNQVDASGWRSWNVLDLMPELMAGTTFGILISAGWTYTVDPDGSANEPYLSLTYTGLGAPIVSIPAGKTTDLHEVVFKGVTGGLITTGVSIDATATAHISSCRFDSAIRRGLQNGGTAYSVGNTYQTVLYDLINTGTALYTAGDCYTTSSGTITPRGNADMVDGHHIVYDSDYKCYLI